MPLHPAMRCLLLACALFLTACAGEKEVVTQIERVRQKVPASLLDCQPEPAVPPGDSHRQVNRFILDLVEAGADCRDKLRAVRGLMEGAGR